MVHRADDDDGKLVVAPGDVVYSGEQIIALTGFQERYFRVRVVAAGASPPCQRPSASPGNQRPSHGRSRRSRCAACTTRSKPGGRLFLADVVFSFETGAFQPAVHGWLAGMEATAGTAMRDEAEVHVRDEFSTWDRGLAGMLERAGLEADSSCELMPNTRVYLCHRP